MKKYYFGLLVLGLLTVGLLGYAVVLGSSAKQDSATLKKAQEIAPKLNSYIRQQNKIPDSLDAAGITGVPSTISYKKVSAERYTFCVTYKTAKSGGGVSVPEVITRPLFGRPGYPIDDGGISLDSSGSYEPSTLYVYATYKKGESCTTVKPYLYKVNTYNSETYRNTVCNKNYKYYDLYKSYCAQTQSTSPSILQ